jgi:hypothetical protein
MAESATATALVVYSLTQKTAEAVWARSGRGVNERGQLTLNHT